MLFDLVDSVTESQQPLHVVVVVQSEVELSIVSRRQTGQVYSYVCSFAILPDPGMM